MFSRKHIPNLLIVFRVVIIPAFILGFYLDAPTSYILTFALFLLASISDFFDGHLARKWNVKTEIGRVMDPIADKLIVAAALIMLASDHRASAVAVTLILMRELLVSGLRECLAEYKITLHVSKLAKWKTATQMIALLLLLLAPLTGAEETQHLGEGFLWLATLLTVLTGAQYVLNSLPHLKNK